VQQRLNQGGGQSPDNQIKSESKLKGNKMSYLAEIETRVAGIPCIIGVTEYQEGSGDYWCDSDMDYYGYSDWVVCDRRGRPAPWLERKLTDSDRSRIESEIADQLN
jgi:hypothetical protein